MWCSTRDRQAGSTMRLSKRNRPIGILEGLAVAAGFLLLVVGAPRAETVVPPAVAIATAHPLATGAGAEILAQGGNAFDAAVAISAALAVVEPMSSGLGGGGFWLLHRAADGFEVMIDGRERAPRAATVNMYLDHRGEVIPRLSLDGPLAAGIPGTPAALVHIATRYGRLPLAQSLIPAIRYAEKGFSVTTRYRERAARRRDVLAASPAAAKVFLKGGRVPEIGDVIHQPALAKTLERIARKGREGFYRGRLARRLVGGVQAAGGIWTRADLTDYRVVERRPIVGRYRGVRVVSAALPSSGGIVLVEMLNILRGFDLDHLTKAHRAHAIIEAMRRAYRDRARFLGDADYVPVNVARLLSREYAAAHRATIRDAATPSADLPYHRPPKGADTTHFSVLDREGNRVAATLSINYPFGCGFMPPGTGVLLNNEMDDFSVKPGTANVYGLIGAAANAIAPGKRPLSSMSPTFLETPDAVVVLGTPGGSRIITTVLLATLEFAHGQGGVTDWIRRPRFHHQYLPDVVVYETGAFSEREIKRLEGMGHRLERREPGYGNMQTLGWDKKRHRILAASDPRGEGPGLG